MIEDVTKTVKAYRELNPLGKRIFRDEVGLSSPKGTRRRGASKGRTTGRRKNKAGGSLGTTETGIVDQQ